MNRITEGKNFCYRYYEGNDSEGRPTITLWKRVIIRETGKTFWHVEDMPYMSFEQLVNIAPAVPKSGKNSMYSAVKKAQTVPNITTQKKKPCRLSYIASNTSSKKFSSKRKRFKCA